MNNYRSKIILVDDNMTNLVVGKDLLKASYEVYPALSAVKLFEIMEKIIPDLILLDIEMPQINGYEAIKKLKADPRYAKIPVIFLTAKNDEGSELTGFDLGAADYISKPFSGPRLLKRIANQLLIVQQRNDIIASQAALKDYADNLEIKVREKTKAVFSLQNAVLATVTDLVEFRDNSTGSHVTRTKLYMQTLLDKLLQQGIYKEEISAWDMDFLLPSAKLHDVGKIAIPDHILNKPGKLTPKEFEIMKTHVPAGVDAIKRIMQSTEEHAFLNHALLFAQTHHEKWDGTGYPAGLKGKDIPLEGRLMAIADVYDALISERPYKDAIYHEAACAIMRESSGTHFDPVLEEVFRSVADEFAKIARETGK